MPRSNGINVLWVTGTCRGFPGMAYGSTGSRACAPGAQPGLSYPGPHSELHEGPQPSDAHRQLIIGLTTDLARAAKPMMIGAQLGPFRRSCPRGHMQAIPGLDLLPDLSHFGQQLWVFVAKMAEVRQQTWDGLHVSPRTAPSKGAKLCTHHHWFGRSGKIYREP